MYFSIEDKPQFILQYILARASMVSDRIDLDGVIKDAEKAWEVAWNQ